MSSSTTTSGFRETQSSSFPVDSAWLTTFGDFREVLEDLPASWLESVKVSDRRTEPRCACDSRASLVPLDESADKDAPPTPIELLDISRHGIGFTHTEPLPYRMIQISFNSDDSSAPVFIVRLQWCRFRKPGVYESGGQIQRVISRVP